MKVIEEYTLVPVTDDFLESATKFCTQLVSLKQDLSCYEDRAATVKIIFGELENLYTGGELNTYTQQSKMAMDILDKICKHTQQYGKLIDVSEFIKIDTATPLNAEELKIFEKFTNLKVL